MLHIDVYLLTSTQLCGKVEGVDMLKKTTAAENQELEMPVVVSKP